MDLAEESLGQWEPSFDPGVWRTDGVLHLYAQAVGQEDGDQIEDRAPTMASVLEWRPDW